MPPAPLLHQREIRVAGTGTWQSPRMGFSRGSQFSPLCSSRRVECLACPQPLGHLSGRAGRRVKSLGGGCLLALWRLWAPGAGLRRTGPPSILGAGPLPGRSQLRMNFGLRCPAVLPGGAADLLMGWLSSSSCPEDSGLGSQGPPGPGAGSRICPQPQPPAPSSWRRPGVGEAAGAELPQLHPCSNPSRRRRQWKAASSRGFRGCRTRGAASTALTPRVSSTLSSLEAAGPERGSQRSAPARTRMQGSGSRTLAPPHRTFQQPCSSSLNFRHCHEKQKHPGVLDFDTACTLSRAHRTGGSPQGPRAACSRAAAPPGRSSLWPHQAPGSQGLPRPQAWGEEE
ncbi:uncharacterized protein LOC113220263 [Piliocolobus tephrosceles]|uniref:uncharacterized protein LOC113220263 n=1 Tax=Piliocolobus tephrosceles TaxID=591936 RepID=UPI000E6AF601|nr:uncharacterized protein LOC113220263 [Piliocolobus tephrosceles]